MPVITATRESRPGAVRASKAAQGSGVGLGVGGAEGMFCFFLLDKFIYFVHSRMFP